MLGAWSLKRLRPSASDLIVLALLGWAALSLLWSHDPRNGGLELARAGMLAAVFLLARNTKDVSAGAVTLAVAVIIVASIWLWPDWSGFGNPNFLAEFLLISAPFCVYWGFGGKPQTIIAALVLTGALIVLFHIPTYIWIAPLGVWIALISCLLFGWRAVPVLVAGFAAVVWLAQDTSLMLSIAGRLELWINTLSALAGSPVFGHGLGAFDYIYDPVREDHFAWFPALGTIMGGTALTAGAAHNEILQIWAEIGLPGLFLAGWLAIRAWRAGDPLCRCVMTTAGALEMIEFPMHLPPTGALIALAIGYGLRHERGFRVNFPVLPVRGIAVCAAVVACFIFLRSFSAEVQMAEFERNINRSPVTALSANLAAYQTFSWDARIRRQLSMTLSKVAGVHKKNLRISPDTADLIWKISKSAGPSQPAVVLARIQYLVNSGRGAEAGPLMGVLLKNASHYPDVWVAEAFYAATIADWPRVSRAADRLFSMPQTQDAHRDQVFNLLQRIRKDDKVDDSGASAPAGVPGESRSSVVSR